MTRVGPVPRTLRPIFRDREDFSASHSLTEQTMAALAGSQFMVVLCSPNSAKSKYVNGEIRAFKAMGRDGRVIAVIVDGEPGDPERECFPQALQFEVGADGVLTAERAEPIAADARTEGDGKRMALQKVLAGLLGVPFDDVRKRDAIADSRRIKIRAAGIGVVAVLAMLAGYFYWHAGRVTTQVEQQQAQIAELKAITAKLLSMSQAQAASAPGTQQAVGEAVASAQAGAAQGDARLAKALELLKAGKVAEAEPLFRAVAEEKEKTAASIVKTAANINKEAAAA